MMRLVQHCLTQFGHGTRVLELKGRNKDDAGKRAITRVTHSVEQFARCLSELVGQARLGERIYGTAGARDMKKAIRFFKERQLAADYDDRPERFYERIEDRWASCLMSPSAQDEKMWLFDCDTHHEEEVVLYELEHFYNQPMTPYWYDSKSGRHCLVQPFNRMPLNRVAQSCLHENALILWGY